MEERAKLPTTSPADVTVRNRKVNAGQCQVGDRSRIADRVNFIYREVVTTAVTA